jgi:SNF2 family DNA or RNA helicase
MSKLASRNKNKYAFDEFEDEIKNIREYPTPNKIATQLMPHQAQALTWMKYREQKLSSKFVLRENYKGSVIPKDRALSVYWEEIKLIDGKTFYINYFTGEFSTRPTYSKVVQGGILAHDMGLGKTLIVLSLIYDDEMDTFTRPKKGVLTGKNLYVTVGTVIPNEIENLLRKHVKPPLKYIIIDKDNRKLSKPLQDYDIVIVSY